MPGIVDRASDGVGGGAWYTGGRRFRRDGDARHLCRALIRGASRPFDGLPGPARVRGIVAPASSLGWRNARVAVWPPTRSQRATALAKYAAASAYRLKRTRLNEELAELDYLQRDAEQSGDEDGLRALLRRKLHLLSQRRALDDRIGSSGLTHRPRERSSGSCAWLCRAQAFTRAGSPPRRESGDSGASTRDSLEEERREMGRRDSSARARQGLPGDGLLVAEWGGEADE